MKIKTLKSFISEALHIEPKLIRAVVNQLGGWECLQMSAPDITRHGIMGGYRGFVYYHETVPFWRKNRKEILSLAIVQAEDYGGNDVIRMIQNFNCLSNKGKPDYSASEIGRALYGRYNDELDLIYNAMSWYASEEVARVYCDLLECE